MGLPPTAAEAGAGAATMPALCVRRSLFGLWRQLRRHLGGFRSHKDAAVLQVQTSPVIEMDPIRRLLRRQWDRAEVART